MFILQVILITAAVVSVTCNCNGAIKSTENPSTTFHLCDKNRYLNGLSITSHSQESIPTRTLLCCNAPPRWNSPGILDEYPRWSKTDPSEPWIRCSNGYFMNGFSKPPNNQKEKKWDISLMTRVRCVKPASHPNHYGPCSIKYFSDVTSAECSPDNFVVSVKFMGENSKYIHSVKCCTMAQKPYDIHSFEELRERIMATKLTSMAELAEGLGFMHCAGIKGKNCGDDYRHEGNVWYPEENEACHDHNCAHRSLHIEYGNWSQVVKNITYGKSYTDSVDIEKISDGIYHNVNPTSEATNAFEFTKNIQEMITLSKKSSNASGHEMALAATFDLLKVIGVSGSFGVTFQLSHSQTNQTSLLSSRTYTKRNEITLKPLTAVKYTVILRKSRIVIPYTATVLATFSVRFDGYLRGTKDRFEGMTNFHHYYKSESINQYFEYTFGDKNIPFYRALKRESEILYEPWLWKEMESKRPNVRRAIENLVDENSYVFSFNGFLEYVSGTQLDVEWEDVTIDV